MIDLSSFERCRECGKLAYGGETVTLTVAEFEALKTAADQISGQQAIPRYRSLSRSPIARNPKLAEFIIVRIPTQTVSEITEAAKAEFGEGAPSRSSVYRFVQAIMTAPRSIVLS